jgi:hypothetical protein
LLNQVKINNKFNLNLKFIFSMNNILK